MAETLHPGLERRLKAELAGDIQFDRFTRGRYATDASHYQIEPVGVVVPRTDDDVRAAIAIAREEGVPLLPRGGATSQSGQTVGRALVIDFSKHLNRLVEINEIDATCCDEFRCSGSSDERSGGLEAQRLRESGSGCRLDLGWG